MPTFFVTLTRRMNFVNRNNTNTAVDTANAFFGNIFRHYGLPDSIVSDRDRNFTSAFWKRPMEFCGEQRKMSSSRYPQTDGSSEIMNRIFETYSTCYFSYGRDDSDELLPAAEFAFSSAVTEDIEMSPFQRDVERSRKCALDFIHGNKNSEQSVQDLKDRLRTSIRDAQFLYQVSKARQASEASIRYKNPD